MTEPGALVTGASGFIGRHLVDRLLGSGVRVIVLARPESILPEHWRARIDCVACSDWSAAGLRKVLAQREFAVIYHLAVYGTTPGDRDIDQMLRINIEIPAALVRLGKERAARLLMAGTFSEYQKPATQTPLTEQSPLETGKIYGASKAAGGLVASALAANLGVRLRILRLFHVYGPGEAPHRLLPSLVAGLAKGRQVPLSTGTQVRDFVYVEDAVEALTRADAAMASQGNPLTATWNVCTGMGHSVAAFASLVANAMGARAELLGFGELPMRPDDEPWLVGSGAQIDGAIGWRPSHDVETGIRAAVANWMTGGRAAVPFLHRRQF